MSLHPAKELFVFDWNACRPGTKEIVQRALDILTPAGRLQRGTSSFGPGAIMSVRAPTRYGKTPTGRLITGISTLGWQTPDGTTIEPFACINVWVTINVVLRNQAAHYDHWKQTENIFGIKGKLAYGELKDLPNNTLQISPNGELYLAVNIQKIDDWRLETVWRPWIDHMIYKTGLRPIFHFDEVHFYGDDKSWGELIYALQGFGANIIVWTATPKRSDKSFIPGFKTVETGKRSYVTSSVTDSVEIDDEEYLIVQTKEVQETMYDLEADVDIPFSEAWRAGYLRHVSHRTVEVFIDQINDITDPDAINRKLSEISESTLRKNGIIGKVVRNPLVIDECVKRAYEALIEYRRLTPRAAIIVFTISDRDGGTNEHATLIKQAFLRLNKDLKIDIATQKVDDAHNVIEDFPENDHDIIMFKGMGGVGWDCKRACVVLDLGDDRQDASKIQAWMRAATPYEGLEVCTLIIPADKLQEDIWNRCIAGEGGEASETIETIVDQRLKLKDNGQQKPLYLIPAAEAGQIGDNDGNRADGPEEGMARLLYELVPGALAIFPDAKMINRAKQGGLRFEPQPQEEPLDKQIENYQNWIIDMMKSAANAKYNKLGGKDKHIDYGDVSSAMYEKLYHEAHLGHLYGKGNKVRLIRNLDYLKVLWVKAQAIAQEMQRV